MLKKILFGSKAYEYLPLARHLWNKMPEGKKSYRFSGVYIDLAKGINNYIRIRTVEAKEEAICLFATYKYDMFANYSLSIWRVDLHGNLDILLLPDTSIRKIKNGHPGDVACGRFNHDNPSEFILCIQDSSVFYTTLNYVEGTYRDCLEDVRGEAYQYFFKVLCDFKSMTINCSQMTKIKYYDYYSHFGCYPDCNIYYPPGSWEFRWSSEKCEGEKSWTRDSIFDIFVNNDGIKRLLSSTYYMYQWNPVQQRWNIPQQETPPSESRRGHEVIRRFIHYEGGNQISLEDTDRYSYSYRKWGGDSYYFGWKFIDPQNLIQDVYNCKVINSKAFVYFRNDIGDSAHVQIRVTDSKYGDSGVLANLTVPYEPKYYGREHGGNYPVYPTITLLRDEGISLTIDARFVSLFSWAFHDFLSYSFWVGSFADSLEDNNSLFESHNTWLTGFPNPFNKKEYFGIWYSDVPDFGNGGLGWSDPYFWDGFFCIPFSSWDAKISGWHEIRPVKKENFAPSLLSPYFRNTIIVPTRPFKGFYAKGSEPTADWDANILLDATVVQSKNGKVYVNGDMKKNSVDKTKLQIK